MLYKGITGEGDLFGETSDIAAVVQVVLKSPILPEDDVSTCLPWWYMQVVNIFYLSVDGWNRY